MDVGDVPCVHRAELGASLGRRASSVVVVVVVVVAIVARSSTTCLGGRFGDCFGTDGRADKSRSWRYLVGGAVQDSKAVGTFDQEPRWLGGEET